MFEMPYDANAAPVIGRAGFTVEPLVLIIGMSCAPTPLSTVFIVQLHPAIVVAHDESGQLYAHGFGATYVGTLVSPLNAHAAANWLAPAPRLPRTEHAVWLHTANSEVLERAVDVAAYHVA